MAWKIFWTNFNFCHYKNDQKSIFELGKSKTAKNAISQKRVLFDFKSFFVWTFFNFLAHCGAALFFSCLFIFFVNIFVGLFELVKRYKEDMSNERRQELRIPEEAAKSALCACYFGLLWDLYYIQNTTERDSTVSLFIFSQLFSYTY